MPDAKPALGFLARFAVLRGASRELWLTFLFKFLGITAYKLMNVTLVPRFWTLSPRLSRAAGMR